MMENNKDNKAKKIYPGAFQEVIDLGPSVIGTDHTCMAVSSAGICEDYCKTFGHSDKDGTVGDPCQYVTCVGYEYCDGYNGSIYDPPNCIIHK